MTKFKIGDRVATYYGDGTIVAVDTLWGDFEKDCYAIEMDSTGGLFWNHDCMGLTKAGHGAYLRVDSLALISRAGPTKVFKQGTQNAMLLAHLLEGRTITRIQADHLYRIASLTRRIRDLRDAGHHIVATTKVDPTGRNYVEYSLRTQKKVG